MENKHTDSQSCEYLSSKDALNSANHYIENIDLYEVECILEAVSVLSQCGKTQLIIYTSGDKKLLSERFKYLGYTVLWKYDLMELSWHK